MPTSTGLRSYLSRHTHHTSPILEAQPFLARAELDADVELGSINDNQTSDAAAESKPSVQISTVPPEYLDQSPISEPPAYSPQSLAWTTGSPNTPVCELASRGLSACFRRSKTRRIERTGGPRLLRRLGRSFLLFLMFLGAIEFVTLSLSLISTFFPHEVEHVLSVWSGRNATDDVYQWPTDYTADIPTVACHSHNDYWRKVPLHSAIQAGCTSVEADVWLIGDELYVGHTSSSLTAARTFTSLYVNPLLDVLEKQNPVTRFHPKLGSSRNGVFDTDAKQTLVLLIDFKTSGSALFDAVSAQLEPLRRKQYLTYFNGKSIVEGPITVVVTGNAPFNKVVENVAHRDMFFDAPLADMAPLASAAPRTLPLVYDSAEELAYLSSHDFDSTANSNKGQGHSGPAPSSPTIYTIFNSYYASASMKSAIGIPMPYLTKKQSALMAEQIAGAHALGLKVRYWSVPSWPISWRNYLWRELVKAGVDYLNVDDLKAATQGTWRSTGPWSRWLGWASEPW